MSSTTETRPGTVPVGTAPAGDVGAGRRRRGAAWVAGAAAVLLGGSTFALWTVSDVVDGGTISPGDLDLRAVGQTSFWDVSSDRSDASDVLPGTDGSQLGLVVEGEWYLVPGDKVAAVLPAEVVLDGDELVGRLSASGAESLVDGEISGMTYSYEVYLSSSLRDDAGGTGQEVDDVDARLVVTERLLPTDPDADLVHLAAPGASRQGSLVDGPSGVPVVELEGTSEVVTVVVYGSFFDTSDGFVYGPGVETVGGQTDVLSTDVLDEVTLVLDQLRSPSG